MENKELISLFDYLHRPAGSEVGAQVAKVAAKLKEPIGTRNVTNTRYKGIVHLYRREFLQEYFEADRLGLDPLTALTYLRSTNNKNQIK